MTFSRSARGTPCVPFARGRRTAAAHSAAQICAIALVAFVAACADAGAPTSPGDPNGSVVVPIPGGLVQTVTLSPQPVSTGDVLTIRSVIANRGQARVPLESRICGLDLAGTLEVAWPPGLIRCAGYSTSGELAPGDSLVEYEYKKVVSRPGLYELRVQHALHPSAVVTLPVQVDAP